MQTFVLECGIHKVTFEKLSNDFIVIDEFIDGVSSGSSETYEIAEARALWLRLVNINNYKRTH